MKTKEEIEQLAKNSWEGCDGCDAHDEYFFIKGFECGYRQLRDEVYTKEDMVKAYQEGKSYVADTPPYFDSFEQFIKSIKK